VLCNAIVGVLEPFDSGLPVVLQHIVGDVERATYKPIATAKFEEHPEVFTKVASFGDTSIYRTYLSKYNPTYKSALKK